MKRISNTSLHSVNIRTSEAIYPTTIAPYHACSRLPTCAENTTKLFHRPPHHSFTPYCSIALAQPPDHTKTVVQLSLRLGLSWIYLYKLWSQVISDKNRFRQDIICPLLRAQGQQQWTIVFIISECFSFQLEHHLDKSPYFVQYSASTTTDFSSQYWESLVIFESPFFETGTFWHTLKFKWVKHQYHFCECSQLLHLRLTVFTPPQVYSTGPIQNS